MTNGIEEILGTQCMFVIGSNTTENHPIIGAKMIQAKRNGAKMIVADPRRIDLARHADIYLQDPAQQCGASPNNLKRKCGDGFSGVIQGIYMVVTVIGPILGGILAYRVEFQSDAAGCSLHLLPAGDAAARLHGAFERFKPERTPARISFKGLKTQLVSIFGLLFAGGILTWIWVTDGLLDTSFNSLSQLFPIYLSDIGHLTVEQIGLFGSFFGGACILGNFIGGWLTDKWSERTILTGGFAMLAASLVMMVTASSYFGFLLSRILMGLGDGVLSPAYSSLISRVVPEEKRGIGFWILWNLVGSPITPNALDWWTTMGKIQSTNAILDYRNCLFDCRPGGMDSNSDCRKQARFRFLRNPIR